MGMMQKQFADLITFTRSGIAGYWNWQGQFTMAAANEPRIDHDPATLSLSTSSITLGAGEHTFATTYLYTVGAVLRVSADANNWMTGIVIAASAGSVKINVSSNTVTGSGTYASWTLIVRKGIWVEEQRTNLLTYSEQFDNAIWVKQTATISPNSTIAPDGTSSADKMVTSVGATLGVYQFPLGYAINTDHTVSVFAKADGRNTLQLSWNGNGTAEFNLATGVKLSGPTTAGIQSVGNGWYRCWTVAQRSSTGQALTFRFGAAERTGGDGTSGIYIWGAQLEAGAFPTSYIPTAASQVTRSADVASVNTLSPWYNPEQGSIVVSGQVQNTSSGGFASVFTIEEAPAIYMGIRGRTSSNQMQGIVEINGAASADLRAPWVNKFRCAMAVKADSFSMSLNGGVPVTDTSGPLPTAPIRAGIGSQQNPAIRFLNGHIESIEYHPRKYDGSTLQELAA